MKSSSEPLVQNQNNVTEMVLILPTAKIDQKVQVGGTTWRPELNIGISLNHTSSTYVPGLRRVVQGPRALLFDICVCLCDTVMSVSCSLVVTCWERLTSWLSCM